MCRQREPSLSQEIHSDNVVERDRETIQASPCELCIGHRQGASASCGPRRQKHGSDSDRWSSNAASPSELDSALGNSR
jgi:hypothetical protein